MLGLHLNPPRTLPPPLYAAVQDHPIGHRVRHPIRTSATLEGLVSRQRDFF